MIRETAEGLEVGLFIEEEQPKEETPKAAPAPKKTAKKAVKPADEA